MASFSAGTTFTDGVANDVTAAKLAALVNAATPTSGLIQDRTAETAIAVDDTLLIGDASDSNNLKRMTVANFNNVVTTGTGTAASPAIVPTGDTNTGIFFPAADTIAFSEGGAEAMRIDSSGNVMIGTASPRGKLDVNGGLFLAAGNQIQITGNSGLAGLQLIGADAAESFIGTMSSQALVLRTAATERLRIDSSGSLILIGSYAQKASGTAWENPSDVRIKKNIRDYEKGLDSLMQVRVREWEYNGKAGAVADTKSMGVVADEIETILPDTVSTYKAKLNPEDEEDSDIKKFDATEITWLLVKAVQELSAKVTALEAV